MNAPASWISAPHPPSYDALVNPPVRDRHLKPDAQAVSAFATSNGWEYFLAAGSQPLPGVVFRDERGKARMTQRAGDIVRVPGPAALEIGNSAYSFAVNLNLFSVEWGYAAVRLPYSVPSLIAETRTAREQCALPALPDVAPLPLAADRDAGDLYVAPDAVQWATAVLTPEVVAMLDDTALPLDIEISGGWLFLYHPGRLSVPDPAVWQRVFAVLDAIGSSLAAAVSSLPPAVPADRAAPSGEPTAGVSAPGQAWPDPSRSEESVSSAPPPPASPSVTLPVRERAADVKGRKVWTFYGLAAGAFVVLMSGAYFLFAR